MRLQSPITLICESYRERNLGWEDAYVKLFKLGVISRSEREDIRRFYLGLSKYTKRYST